MLGDCNQGRVEEAQSWRASDDLLATGVGGEQFRCIGNRFANVPYIEKLPLNHKDQRF